MFANKFEQLCLSCSFWPPVLATAAANKANWTRFLIKVEVFMISDELKSFDPHIAQAIRNENEMQV